MVCFIIWEVLNCHHAFNPVQSLSPLLRYKRCLVPVTQRSWHVLCLLLCDSSLVSTQDLNVFLSPFEHLGEGDLHDIVLKVLQWILWRSTS